MIKDPHEYRTKFDVKELDLIKKFNIKSILEVFSGDGKNILFFSKNNYNVTGIESEDKYIKKSIELINKENLSAKIIKHPIFNKKLPFNNEQFDFIYSYQYLNHNYKESIEFVFNEIYRILKKEGLFSIKISDIEQFNLKHIKGNIYEEKDKEFPQIKYKKVANQTFIKLEGEEKNIPHYAFHEKELLNSLQKIGFKLINIRKIKWNIVANFSK
ncbi:MAG: class I SAM-dependent methyltransferase [Candidatus Woesearchaeota archaeon]